jgi:hypothetical protein
MAFLVSDGPPYHPISERLASKLYLAAFEAKSFKSRIDFREQINACMHRLEAPNGVTLHFPKSPLPLGVSSFDLVFTWHAPMKKDHSH